MPRFCSVCGRPRDLDHHDDLGKRSVVRDKGMLRREQQYGCRVRLIADRTAINIETGKLEPTGEHFVPETPFRTRVNNARFVPEDLF